MLAFIRRWLYKFDYAIVSGVAVGLLLGRRLVGSTGAEWTVTYAPAAVSGFAASTAANPPYVAALLYPLTLLPFAADIFTALNLAALLAACWLAGGRRWLALLSFPAAWLVWYGQIDGLVMLGAALGWWAMGRKKYGWVGVALVLLGIKPHVGGVLALIYGWQSRRRWPVYVAPALVLAVSVAWLGFWPPAYAQKLLGGAWTGLDQAANIGMYPYGLAFWLILWMVRDKVRPELIMAATMLSMPYCGYYSVLALLAFPLPWWIVALFSSPLLLGHQWGGLAVKLALMALACSPFVAVVLKAAIKQADLLEQTCGKDVVSAAKFTLRGKL